MQLIVKPTIANPIY